MGRPNPELNGMCRHAKAIFQHALVSADPGAAVRRHVNIDGNTLAIGTHRLDMDTFNRVWLVGAGKASAPMGRALEDLLGDAVTGGVMVVKEGYGDNLQRVQTLEAGHPLPDRRGVAATEKLTADLDRASENDLVVCLLSGGGSALLVAPAEGIDLEEKQEATRMLLACGADIHEINTVRKHISAIKGGLLCRRAHPATLISLVLSDVVGDDLDVIASGPTVPDPSTFADARAVLRRRRIWDRVAPSIRRRIDAGTEGRIAETPKPGDDIFKRSTEVLVGTNFRALQASAEAARELGYESLILTSSVTGEAREAARLLAAVAREVRRSGQPLPPPACILMGGETTVTIRGNGLGGRNQEFALAAALAVDGLENVVVLAGGTDGTDGPTDAAGAVIDGSTARRSRQKGIDPNDYLERNDAYRLFDATGDLLITGPTRTNVMDIYMALVG